MKTAVALEVHTQSHPATVVQFFPFLGRGRCLFAAERQKGKERLEIDENFQMYMSMRVAVLANSASEGRRDLYMGLNEAEHAYLYWHL